MTPSNEREQEVASAELQTPSFTVEDAGSRRLVRDRSLLGGVAWTGMAKILAQGAAWSSTILVARYLAPDDYGVVGVAMFCLGLIELVTEFGIGTTVAMQQDLSTEQIQSLNSVSVILGVGGMLAVCAIAPLMAMFFHDSRIASVLIVLSVTFLLRSFRSVPWGLLQRDLEFKRLALYDGAQGLVLAGVSVAFATLGFKYWTMVAASVAGGIIALLLAVTKHPVAFRRPRLSELGHLLSFSGYLIGQRAAWFAYSNADFVIAGRVLGPGPLGAYTLAWTLAHVPDKVTAIVLQVTLPILSQVAKEREELQRLLIRIVGAMNLMFLPLMVGLALVAPEFVPTVLGAKWTAMILPLQLLSVYTIVNVTVPIMGQMLIITGHVAYGLRHNMLQLVVMPIAFIAGAHLGGINGIAIAWIAIHPFLAARITLFALGTIDLSPGRLFREALLPPLLGCGCMAVAVILARSVLQGGKSMLLQLALEVAAGAIGYSLAMFLFYRNRISGTIAFVRDLRTKAAPI